jgi:hypothetical protein
VVRLPADAAPEELDRATEVLAGYVAEWRDAKNNPWKGHDGEVVIGDEPEDEDDDEDPDVVITRGPDGRLLLLPLPPPG